MRKLFIVFLSFTLCIVFVSSTSYVWADVQLAPDGTYVDGDPQLAPDGTYVGGDPQLAPDGTYVGGDPELANDGTSLLDVIGLLYIIYILFL